MTPRQNPYVWVTYLPSYLTGRAHCLWSLWFRANYSYDRIPSSFDEAKWKAGHTKVLNKAIDKYKKQFDSVRIENQNYFTYQGQSGTQLAGKPDLIGISKTRAFFCDAKNVEWTEEKHEDALTQILLYMWAFKKRFPEMFGDLELVGEVFYDDESKNEQISYSRFDDNFKQNLGGLFNVVKDRNKEPSKVPSEHECSKCKIGAQYCAQRLTKIEENNPQLVLGDF